MTQVSWPYAGDPVNETEWRAMSRLWREPGVVEGVGQHLDAELVSGELRVRVHPGEAWLDGHYFGSSAQESLDLATADLDNDRIDLVVVRSVAEDRARLAVVTGTPASSPSAPSPTQDHEGVGVWELPLWEVRVESATAEGASLTDRRAYSIPTGRAHNDLQARGAAGAHPVTAIDGLTQQLGAKVSTVGGTIRGYREPAPALPSSGTVTLDFSQHNVWEVQPTAPITVQFAGLPGTGTTAAGTLIVRNDDHAISWPSGVQAPDGTLALDGKTLFSIVKQRTGTVLVMVAANRFEEL